MNYRLAIHGGAGTILKSAMSPEKEALYRQALDQALQAGEDILAAGGLALDAVEAAVRSLEDCPLFNAGRGSVYTAAGTQEMDASIMDGRDRSAGAVAMVKGIRNPISLARRVMSHSGHVLLAGEGALVFAQAQGFELMPPEYFHDEYRYQQWLQVRDSDSVILDHSDAEEDPHQVRKFGTVGAVALDAQGNLAAATSTGGMTNKKFGRIGDSPLIGAGTYARNGLCAISCTGSGEFFIRGVAAYDLACLMQYAGLSLEAACHKVVQEHLPEIGGDGGLIAIDAQGNICLPFNTEGMYRGWAKPETGRQTFIYEAE